VDLLRLGEGGSQVISRAAGIAALVIAASAAAAPGSSRQRLFAVAGAGPMHARAHYRDSAGGEHTLEVWRTERAIRRDTDGKLTLIVERGSDGDNTYHVIDRVRNRRYDVARSNSYRIGSFPEWGQMASLLTTPAGNARVVPLARPSSNGCRWYEITARGSRERVCWSSRYKLALSIEQLSGERWIPVLTVDDVQPQAVAAAVFTLPGNLVRVDMDRDLD
jgi:hypothetical protein